jgi:anti-sigma B factor antagonist
MSSAEWTPVGHADSFEPFSASLVRHAESAILALRGEVDLSSAPHLREIMQNLISEGVPEVVVDLSGVDFLDSTGLAVFIWARKQLDAQDHRLIVRAPKPAQQRLFEITRLMDYLRVETEPSVPK